MKNTLFKFIDRASAMSINAGLCFDVSSRSKSKDLVPLSPFFSHGNLPVPGMQETFSDSVEGVHQGLKFIADKGIDTSYFVGKGRKRRGKVLGSQFKGKLLTYLEARQKIYIPSYRSMVTKAPQAKRAAVTLLKIALESEQDTVYLYDFEKNGDPLAPKPLAHASILAWILNEELALFVRYLDDENFRASYDSEPGPEWDQLAERSTCYVWRLHPLTDILIEETKNGYTF